LLKASLNEQRTENREQFNSKTKDKSHKTKVKKWFQSFRVSGKIRRKAKGERRKYNKDKS
jgi:hypothetical protein